MFDCVDITDKCQLHPDHSRRIAEIEQDIHNLDSAQSKIKVDISIIMERSNEAHRRIGETKLEHTSLAEKVVKMNERFNDRDMDQDKRINALTVKLAVILSIVQTTLVVMQQIAQYLLK